VRLDRPNVQAAAPAVLLVGVIDTCRAGAPAVHRNIITHPKGSEMNQDLRQKGQKLRREVLGDAYVDAAEKKTTDFNRPFQELIAEYVWGTLWSRKGLDRRTRALINIAMLTAMGRVEEVKLYLKAAPNVGVTQDDVREVLLQTAIYCGIPAALDSFRIAQEIYAEAPGQAPKAKGKGKKDKSKAKRKGSGKRKK